MMRWFIVLIIECWVGAVLAQPSYGTSLAIRMRDDKGEIVNVEKFKTDYQFKSVGGNVISNEDLHHFLWYHTTEQYIIVSMDSPAYRFSCAIGYKNQWMIFYLPFARGEHDRYAIEFSFRPGTYYLDFNSRRLEKIELQGNTFFYRIESINWKKQQKLFLKTEYVTDRTYDD